MNENIRTRRFPSGEQTFISHKELSGLCLSWETRPDHDEVVELQHSRACQHCGGGEEVFGVYLSRAQMVSLVELLQHMLDTPEWQE